uniref:IST1 homolog n=1 Tax=Aceria tosichella TaxID=561515 RepID=A0A6G1S5S3_9ACAR
MSVDYAKLKTNLNLIMHRLKLVEKKKMELNQKARRTIAEFLNAGKVDRARIRVEQIVREDYIVEAMDLVESYCDFLISRFGQLQSTETVDEGLATAISSLIWVSPFFESDVPELKTIADQLGRKYGKQYVIAARENTLKTVNETLIKKMSVQVPSKVLVEKYLVEIAKDQKIDYKPDPRVMKESEALNSTAFGQAISSDDDDDNRGGGGGGQRQSGQAPQSGFNLINLGDHYPRSPITQPSFNPYGQPPPLPSEPPLGPSQPVGPVDLMTDTIDATAPSAQLPIGFNLSSTTDTSTGSSSSATNQSTRLSDSSKDSSSKTKPLHSANDSLPEQKQQKSGASSSGNQEGAGGPPPNYDSVVNKSTNQTQYYSFGPDSSFAPHHGSKDDLNDTLPELPPVPKDVNDGGAHGSNSDERLDLEDLTRRFEELKNKKN